MASIFELYHLISSELQGILSLEAESAKSDPDVLKKEAQQRQRITEEFQTEKNKLKKLISQAESYRDAAALCTSQRKIAFTDKKPDFDFCFLLYTSIELNAREDPAAAELWARSNGAIFYLENQIKMLSAGLDRALREISSRSLSAGSRLQQKIDALYNDFFQNPLLPRLSDAIRQQTKSYYISNSSVYSPSIPQENSPQMKLGMVQMPLPIAQKYHSTAQRILGACFNPTSRSIVLPLDLQTENIGKILVSYPSKVQTQVQDYLIGFLFNILRHYTPLANRVYYLDSVSYNPAHLNVMKAFTGKDSMICFPKTSRELDLALSALLASNGMDAENREDRFLIVRDFPGNLSSWAQEKILNICSNAAYYQITVLFTYEETQRNQYSDTEEKATSGALPILYKGAGFQVQIEGRLYPFFWFSAPMEISESSVEEFSEKFRPVLKGCAYDSRIDVEHLPKLRKGNKFLSVPIGVDDSDQLTYLDMNGMNFATYLMGASGSGKSTLLHTIITGIIRNYHPDDVELWLADFKMGEFSQYMNPRPPHVKYVLMDDSQELVYDFLNLLNQELTRRKRFFSEHSEYKKVETVPSSYRMPLIVVIIDEFSLMSQAISEDQNYRLILQNLLSGGRAPGFRFIFSSQDYTHGITGLTEMAKSQIQSRLAMKNTLDEIRDTLSISNGTMTDKLKTWTETLPPYTVISSSVSKESVKYARSQVLYFPDRPGRNTYDLQKQMILEISSRIRPVSPRQFDPQDPYSYVDKKPMDADGNTLKAFTPKMFKCACQSFMETHQEDYFPGDTLVAAGEPRRLERTYVFPVADENRENLLLVSGSEKLCSASIIHSVIQSFQLQDGQVQIWAYRRNHLYWYYKNSHPENCSVLTDAAEIGREIEGLKKKIKARQPGKELIVLLGIDHIQDDFEFIEEEEMPSFAMNLEVDQEMKDAEADVYAQIGDALDEIQQRGIEQDKSPEEINQEIENFLNQYYGQESMPEESMGYEEPIQPTAAYEKPDYARDLQYIVGQGPHCGYHFLLCGGSYPEIRRTGLNTDWFLHKMSFRISQEDASMLFGNRTSALVPDHVCMYQSDQNKYSFRPFLHPGISWGGWKLDDNGNVVKSESEV